MTKIWIERLTFFFVTFTIIILGLSVGAMLGEQQTMVPYWQELSSGEFFAWYGKNATRLKEFFSPLQISSAVFTLIATVLFRIQRRPGTLWLGLAAFFSFAILATFFLFFRDVNASFVAKSLTPEQLSNTLVQWSMWQWGRIGLGMAAFATALLGASRALLGISHESGEARKVL